MKAFLARSYGGPDVMTLGELPEPSPGPGEVLVTVRASSVNPVDFKVRQGSMRLLTGRRFPKVFGSDLAGIVKTLGAGVGQLKVGDPVYGAAPVMFGRAGAHAEQIVVSAKHLRLLPGGIGFEQAAALPVAALTALNGLRQCGELRGKRLIVNGATGGVGHFALQIARARGARVTAVCSAGNMEQARSLGADPVIDYKQEAFTQGKERYDVVFDAFGHLAFPQASRALEPAGTFVTTLPSPSLLLRAVWRRIRGGQRIVMGNMRDKPEDYAALEALLVTGEVRPIVLKVFPLEQAAQAFAALEAGGTVGKVVIRVS